MKRPSFFLATLALAACTAPAAPPAPTPTTTPVAVASVEASSAPGPVIRRSLPPPNTSGAVTAYEGPTVTMTGTVYSTEGLELYRSHVAIQSLEPGRPFSARVTAMRGRYEIKGVPANTQVRINASIIGYEIRSQMYTTSDDPAPEANRLDFSGPYALPKEQAAPAPSPSP
jgi:hypothetical protein